MIATVAAALLAGMLGLIVSIRYNGAGPLLGTSAGRWLAEHVVPSHVPAGMHAADEGDLVGPLALTDLDGHAQPLPAPQGRRVLVNVWASWCGPCRDEMPLLDRFAQAQGTGGIAVVGIAQDDAASVRGYLRQVPTAYPILLDDAQGNAGVRLGNRLGALPYSVLIDAKGRLLRRKYGPFASARALQEWIAEPGQNP